MVDVLSCILHSLSFKYPFFIFMLYFAISELWIVSSVKLICIITAFCSYVNPEFSNSCINIVS